MKQIRNIFVYCQYQKKKRYFNKYLNIFTHNSFDKFIVLGIVGKNSCVRTNF